MAWPVYSIQVFSAVLTAEEESVDVPAGTIWILRDVDAFEETLTTGSQFIVYNGAAGPLWRVLSGGTVPTSQFQWRGRQVYVGGQAITFQAVSGSWSVQASGYQLSA